MADEASQDPGFLMRALEAVQQTALSGIGPYESAEALADSHLKSAEGNAEQAIDDLIVWQSRTAASVGFVTGIGGLITLPVAIPANLAGVYFLQLRMINAIALLRGHDVTDPQVRSFVFLALAGEGMKELLKEAGVTLAQKAAIALINRIPGEVIKQINRMVAMRLVSKAGEKTVISFTRLVPLVGGVIGGSIDNWYTYGVGKAAKEVFTRPVEGPIIEGTVIG